MSNLPDTSAVPDCAAAVWDQWQLRQALWAWTLRTTASTLTSQGFLVYYLLELKASDRLLGLAAALPSFAFAAQFAGSVWAERTASRRRLCVRLFIANALCWLPTLVVGLWAAGSAERYPVARVVFVASLTLMAVFFHLHSPAWDSLFSDAVPDKQKSVFLGKWGLWSGISVAACSIFGGWLIEVVSHGQTAVVRQTMYLAVFAASLICSLVAGWFYSGVEDVPAQSERYSIRELIRLALAQRNYMTFMSVHAIRTIAMGVYAAFIIAWFRESLGMSILFLCFLGAWATAISALVGALGPAVRWQTCPDIWICNFDGEPGSLFLLHTRQLSLGVHHPLGTVWIIHQRLQCRGQHALVCPATTQGADDAICDCVDVHGHLRCHRCGGRRLDRFSSSRDDCGPVSLVALSLAGGACDCDPCPGIFLFAQN